MRIAIAAASILLAAAPPALAQTGQSQSEGERIVNELLGAVFGRPQAQTQTPLATGPQSQVARFAVTNISQDEVCEMNLGGSGQAGTVSPGQNCPGALRNVTRWEQSSAEDLSLLDSAGRIQWRGERVANRSGWIGGAADTLRVYSIAPSGDVGPAGGAAGGQAAAPAAPAFSGEVLYGDWRITEPGQTVGCRASFVRPAQNNPFAVTNAVQTQAGCPGETSGATRWVFGDNALTLTDNVGNVRATLTRVSDDRWTGTSGGIEIVLTRI